MRSGRIIIFLFRVSILFFEAKREFNSSINEKDVTDKKIFWKTVKPFLSDKTVAQSKVALLDKNMPVTEDKKIIETLNNFFHGTRSNLKYSILWKLFDI